MLHSAQSPVAGLGTRLGDSILGLHAQSNVASRCVDLFESKRASCVIAVEEGPPEQTRHYGIVASAEGDNDWLRVQNLVEKPRPEEAPSNPAIAGRCVFSPLIFDMLRRVKPDKHGEIQLTDAIQLLCEEGKRAVKLPAGDRRYHIEFALADPMYGEQFRRFLEQVLAKKMAETV